MSFSFDLLAFGIGLVFLQIVAAVPWVLAVTWASFSDWFRKKPGRALLTLAGSALGAAVVLGAVAGTTLGLSGQRETLEVIGRNYTAILQLQLTTDFFVVLFAALVAVWPKGGAVARAAFREGYRQPLFWLIVGCAVVAMVFSLYIPYFTFGEDYIMYKELGFDTVMLAAVLFGVIAAATSIAEEIEGRTAVTLMSKPISRRQFLLGKYFGIVMVSLVIVGMLGWLLDVALLYKRWFDRMDPMVLPGPLALWLDGVPVGAIDADEAGGGLNVPTDVRHFLRGALLWCLHASEILPGLVLSGSMVLVLVAIAVSLATRLPMIVNLVSCLVIYFLANLMPVLVQTTRPTSASAASPVQKLLFFMAQLFDALLPGLELFRVRPTLVDESTLPMAQYLQHVGAVSLYGLLFTVIVLLLGLVLFEDRDLA